MTTFSVALVTREFFPPAMEKFCEYLNAKAGITPDNKVQILEKFVGIARESAFWMSYALRQFVLTTTSSTCPFADHVFTDSA
jgi:hypothetical protein